MNNEVKSLGKADVRIYFLQNRSLNKSYTDCTPYLNNDGDFKLAKENEVLEIDRINIKSYTRTYNNGKTYIEIII